MRTAVFASPPCCVRDAGTAADLDRRTGEDVIELEPGKRLTVSICGNCGPYSASAGASLPPGWSAAQLTGGIAPRRGQSFDPQGKAHATRAPPDRLLDAGLDRYERIRTVRGQRGERDAPARAQTAEQLPGGGRFAALPASGSAGQQKRFDAWLVERFDTQGLMLEPTTEIADEPKLAHRRRAGVSLCLEARGEPVELTGQRTNMQLGNRTLSTSVFSVTLATLPAGEDHRIIPEHQPS